MLNAKREGEQKKNEDFSESDISEVKLIEPLLYCLEGVAANSDHMENVIFNQSCTYTKNVATTLNRLALKALTNVFYCSEDSKDHFWKKNGHCYLLNRLNSYDEDIINDAIDLLFAFFHRKNTHVEAMAKEQNSQVITTLIKII